MLFTGICMSVHLLSCMSHAWACLSCVLLLLLLVLCCFCCDQQCPTEEVMLMTNMQIHLSHQVLLENLFRVSVQNTLPRLADLLQVRWAKEVSICRKQLQKT